MSVPTIHDVKEDTYEDAPYFFDRATMKTFRQRMGDFHVNKTDNPRIFYIWAASRVPACAGAPAFSHRTERWYVKGRTPGAGSLHLSMEGAIEALAAETAV